MPYPSTYTEAALAEFVFSDELGGLAGIAGECGASVPSDVAAVVNRALRDYPVDDITDATDPDKLRLIASWRAWEWAARQLTTRTRISMERETLDLEKLYEHAVEMRDAYYEQIESQGYVVLATINPPLISEILAKAPIPAPAPGDVEPYPYPDANDTAYSGSPYRRRRG